MYNKVKKLDKKIMKLPITEEFLLDVYGCVEKLDEIFDSFASRTMKDTCCPALYELKQQYKRKKARQGFSQLIYRLKKNGYIEIKNFKQNKGAVLTKKGTEKVLKIKLKIKEKKKRPDKKWQMIIFDIPEKERHLRNLLRDYLRLLEYKMLQQSIWICPYDVLKETELILRKYSLDPYVKLFLIEEVEI
jgi:DNA-binding transcriptional regulator PaaX